MRYVSAVAAASCTLFCAGAGAQSLALSYKLDPIAAPRSHQAPALVDRCSGLTWAASLAAACGSARFGSALATRAGASERTVFPTRASDIAGDAFTGFALPTLGAPSDDGRLVPAAREVPAEAGRPLDLLFRLASKYRLRNAEDGLDVIKFKDVTSENRTQSSGVKALAVELLFPFQ